MSGWHLAGQNGSVVDIYLQSPYSGFLPSPRLALPAILCCCSVTESCPPLCDPMDCSTPGFPVLCYLPEFAQTHWSQWGVNDAIESMMPSNHLILCCPLLLKRSLYHFTNLSPFTSPPATHSPWLPPFILCFCEFDFFFFILQ